MKGTTNLSLYTYGRGYKGQLGHGDKMDAFEPQAVSRLDQTKIISMGAGIEHSACVTDEGTVLTWGDANSGKLGHGDETESSYIPKTVSSLRATNAVACGVRALAVACGVNHTVLCTDDGAVYTWGSNKVGQLGTGDNEIQHNKPCKVGGLKAMQVYQVAAADSYTAALCGNGDVYTWGSGEFGRLGYDTRQQKTPRKIEALSKQGTVSVKLGKFHAISVNKAGTVCTWGYGCYGQLGLGDCKSTHDPTEVTGLGSDVVTNVSVGAQHSAAVTDKGILYTWGSGADGQLGHGDRRRSNSPRVVEYLTTRVVTGVSCGWKHTSCFTDLGEMFSFGLGHEGRLGLGDIDDRTLPTLALPILGRAVREVCAGVDHVLMLVEDDDPEAKLVRKEMQTTAGKPVPEVVSSTPSQPRLEKTKEEMATEIKSLVHQFRQPEHGKKPYGEILDEHNQFMEDCQRNVTLAQTLGVVSKDKEAVLVDKLMRRVQDRRLPFDVAIKESNQAIEALKVDTSRMVSQESNDDGIRQMMIDQCHQNLVLQQHLNNLMATIVEGAVEMFEKTQVLEFPPRFEFVQKELLGAEQWDFVKAKMKKDLNAPAPVNAAPSKPAKTSKLGKMFKKDKDKEKDKAEVTSNDFSVKPDASGLPVHLHTDTDNDDRHTFVSAGPSRPVSRPVSRMPSSDNLKGDSEVPFGFETPQKEGVDPEDVDVALMSKSSKKSASKWKKIFKKKGKEPSP